MTIVDEIIEQVATREKSDPFSLPPLYETIDPNALETVFESSNDMLIIQFSYYGYDITIEDSGTVTVADQ